VLLGRIRALRLLARVTELTELFSQAKEAVGTADESLVAEFAWQEAEAVLAVEADFAKVERLLQQVLNLARSSDHRTLELLASSTYGHLLVMRGEGPRAVNELAKAARGWRTMRGTANLGWVLNNLGMAHLLVGDFSSALRVLREAKAEAARCQNRRTEAFAIASLGDTELALGRFEAARVQYEEAIRICAEEVLDESLATLSVAGLASTMLGLGDRQQADFLARHALEAAGLIGNPFELGQCALLLASVELAAGDARRAVVSAERAVELFASIDARSSLRSAHYRLAVCQFKAGDRRAAVASLTALAEELTEPWMAGALVPLAREHPIVAQWAAGRAEAPPALKLVIEQISGVPETDPPSPDQGELPIVRAHSLGEVRVWVDEHEVTDERWTSARARELFYLFLAHPHGVRKEEAVETLYPDLPPARCNSAFHSNLYRVRHALYRDSVVKQEGIYRLNDDGIFDWDVAEFEACLSRAESLPKGSDERVGLYESALKLYQGPFAEIFESEWAASLREHLAAREQRALALLAGHYAGIGRFEAAAGMLRRILERDPYDDQAAYGLARSQAMAGQASAALHFLDTYTARLQDDLGVAPRAQLVELREAIAAGRAG
jgi:DNA-binding SARP family transcriptional activator